MKTYSVTYDLLKPGQDYQDLWDRLRALKAVKVEESQWILKTLASAVDVANDLLRQRLPGTPLKVSDPRFS